MFSSFFNRKVVVTEKSEKSREELVSELHKNSLKLQALHEISSAHTSRNSFNAAFAPFTYIIPNPDHFTNAVVSFKKSKLERVNAELRNKLDQFDHHQEKMLSKK